MKSSRTKRKYRIYSFLGVFEGFNTSCCWSGFVGLKVQESQGLLFLLLPVFLLTIAGVLESTSDHADVHSLMSCPSLATDRIESLWKRNEPREGPCCLTWPSHWRWGGEPGRRESFWEYFCRARICGPATGNDIKVFSHVIDCHWW